MIWRTAVLLLLLLGGGMARADELRPGYIELTEERTGQWSLRMQTPLRGGPAAESRPLFPRQCRQSGPEGRKYDPLVVTVSLRLHCQGDIAGAEVGLPALERAQTDILLRVQPLGRTPQVFRLTPASPTAVIAARPDRWQVARAYFITGIDHIIFGFDHLLFVVALVLLLSGFWKIAAAVTAFTIAHSITLIGTTLGLLGLPQRPVEAVIALSILFLAMEIVKREPGSPRLSERRPWAVAFAFGLLHGFGFAGALNEIGLPEGEVPMALLTFNLGVEAGQLAVVALTVALVMLLRRLAPVYSERAVRVTTYAIGSIAAFWLIERLA